MPTTNEPLPNVTDKQEVKRDELDGFAKIMEEQVIAQIKEKNRERQEEVEKARTWYVG